ncbi:hypothetical protein PoB_003953000 [Plakobranchus ocellatus]|uniref:Uncharacterized protein n=1 Tax=Plakobranchus ocellatus TaxID=259542 RepID=A0AAV4B0E9_9GAST|nr:hypothetical protein PoB_003953000 [Plakobranchus ocellatus]
MWQEIGSLSKAKTLGRDERGTEAWKLWGTKSEIWLGHIQDWIGLVRSYPSGIHKRRAEKCGSNGKCGKNLGPCPKQKHSEEMSRGKEAWKLWGTKSENWLVTSRTGLDWSEAIRAEFTSAEPRNLAGQFQSEPT